jgi:diacylglycerol kinase (ATP)
VGQAWLIVNPDAGGGRGRQHAAALSAVLAEAGLDCTVVQPTSGEGTREAAREAVAAGARAVLVCGGDGTVHEALQPLVGTDVPLGVMAAGSGDDIALALGFPRDSPAEAAEFLAVALTSGSPRSVDVGHATVGDGTQGYFLGVLSTGFDSAVNERANTMTRLGGQRYNVAILRELASFRPAHYDLTLDDEVISGEAMLVAVGNGSSYGGGMRICPAAVPDDGMLDVTWLSAVSKPLFLRVFPTVFRGRHVDHPAVRTFRGRSLAIAAAGQVAYADGERLGALPVRIETRPGALRVLSG